MFGTEVIAACRNRTHIPYVEADNKLLTGFHQQGIKAANRHKSLNLERQIKSSNI